MIDKRRSEEEREREGREGERRHTSQLQEFVAFGNQ
jgi:hypothetical protein